MAQEKAVQWLLLQTSTSFHPKLLLQIETPLVPSALLNSDRV